MRSTQVFTVLALLATSVSSMSIGSTDQLGAHRRHAAAVAHDSVIQARGARRYVPEQDVSKREETAPHWSRKRGINQRRCAAKSSSSSAALAASTSSAAATSSTPAPTTTSSVEPTTSAKAKYTKSSEPETTSKPETTKATTKTTTKATKTSTSAAAATSSSSSSSSSGTNTGEGTFYATGLGACGITNYDTDYICAVSQSLFDGFEGYTGSDPNSNPICGKKIKATYQGKSVTVTVTDRCVGCAYNDLDFSPSAFDQLADESVGRLTGMTWTWVS